MFRRSLKVASGIFGACAVGTSSFAAYKYNTDPGIRRTMQFSYKIAPICIAYARADTQEFDALHNKYAPELLKIVLEMKGYYIKAAQMLCGINILPSAYDDALKVLLDSVPPRSTDLIKSIIEEELGKPLQEIFSTFEETPIGAASIGQVHLATLKSSGQRVVVKVQYPEVEGFFHLDLSTVKTLCHLMLPDASTDKMFDEVAKSFKSEFDYRLEAKNLTTCSKNLVKGGFGKQAFIPKPFDSMCTRRVMVMEAVKGKPVKKVMKQVFSEMAAAEGKTVEELLDSLKLEFEDPVKLRKMLNAPPPSEAAVRFGLFLISARDLARNTAAFCYNWTLGFALNNVDYHWTTIPPNGPALTRTLYAVHGHQILVDGRFNADPHAGNVLIADDGRLGLIDYGNAPSLTDKERIDIARLIIALDDEDDDAILAAFADLGYSVKGAKEGTELLARKLLLISAYGDFDQQYGTAFFNKHFGYPENLGITDLFTKIDEEMRGAGLEVDIPANIINLQRCVMTLNGVATETGAGNVRPSSMWRNQAEELLSKAN